MTHAAHEYRKTEKVEREGEAGRQAGRQAGRPTGRQADGRADRQAGRQACELVDCNDMKQNISISNHFIDDHVSPTTILLILD